MYGVRMDITRTTAQAVTECLKRSGRSQLSLSEESGIPRTTLLRRLSGATPFTVEELQRIADCLDVPVVSLLGPTDNTGRAAS